MTTPSKEADYLPHSRMLWLAEIIEEETVINWKQAKEIAQQLLDEIEVNPDLFSK
jgi:hypothetical protein